MRTTLDYLPGGGKLNNAASSTAGASVEPVTQLPISTGTNSGDFLELTQAQAQALSNNGLTPLLLTAGSGQTNGTYTAAASYGPGVLTYVVAGNVVTTLTVGGANGVYSPAFVTANGGSAPTFTLAANGGTAGTVQAVLQTLDSGCYQRVKLTSTITTVISGQALFWNPTDLTDPYAVTNVSSSTQDDFAGVVIDPAMGSNPTNSPQLSYAWIQNNGRARALLSGTGVVGAGVGLPSSATNQFVVATVANPTYAGTQLTVGNGAGSSALIRLLIPQTKF